MLIVSIVIALGLLAECLLVGAAVSGLIIAIGGLNSDLTPSARATHMSSLRGIKRLLIWLMIGLAVLALLSIFRIIASL